MLHLDIFGSDNNDEQLEKIPFISVTLYVFQLDISGNDTIEEQHANIRLKLSTFFVSHLVISQIFFK